MAPLMCRAWRAQACTRISRSARPIRGNAEPQGRALTDLGNKTEVARPIPREAALRFIPSPFWPASAMPSPPRCQGQKPGPVWSASLLPRGRSPAALPQLRGLHPPSRPRRCPRRLLSLQPRAPCPRPRRYGSSSDSATQAPLVCLARSTREHRDAHKLAGRRRLAAWCRDGAFPMGAGVSAPV